MTYAQLLEVLRMWRGRDVEAVHHQGHSSGEFTITGELDEVEAKLDGAGDPSIVLTLSNNTVMFIRSPQVVPALSTGT